METRPSSQGSAPAFSAPSLIDPLLGVLLDGRFQVQRVLGEGAMGRVYQAVEVPRGRPVALKVLDTRHGLGREAGFHQRLMVEAALTARLAHPNTVRVLDSGQTAHGLSFIAMEYLEGESLEALLERGALPWWRVVGMAQQMACSLREAHALGVVHRDLKPANVIRLDAGDGPDHLKVLDFGLVKSFVEGHDLEGRAITEQGMVMGSPPYMAPEQGESNWADPRSDIYSLGIVLYEALTGRVPFEGSTPLEVIMKHIRQPVPPLRAPPGLEPIPASMVALVTKCLAKSPMHRFQSMHEVLSAIEAIPSPCRLWPSSETLTEPIERESLPPEQRTRTAARRSRGLRLAKGFSLSLVVALAVGFGVARVYGNGNRAATGPNQTPVEPRATIRFHVETEPRGATVSTEDTVLGATPLDFDHPADPSGRAVETLHLSLPGFRPVTVTAGGSGPRIEIQRRLEVDRRRRTKNLEPSRKAHGQ